MLTWTGQACIKIYNMDINNIISGVEQVHTLISGFLYLHSASTHVFKCNQYKPFNDDADYYN